MGRSKAWSRRCRALGWLGVVVAVPAHALDGYVSVAAGAGQASNSRFDGTGITTDFDLGKPIGAVAAGIVRGAWRFELEGGYRYSDAEVVFFDDGRPDLAVDPDSVLTAWTLGLNAFYTFDGGRGFKPFLGAGIGAAWIDDEIKQYITDVTLLDDHVTTFSYQLVAGLTMPLGRHWDLDLDYRFWQAPDISLESVNGESFDTDHTIHSAMLNLRYHFAPRPATRAGDVYLPSRGAFVQAAAGPVRAKDAEIKNNIANFDAFALGLAWTLTAGYAFDGPWWVGAEVAGRSIEPELIDFNPEFGEDRANGEVRALSLMAVAGYEPRWRLSFQPYVAIAAGAAWSDWDVRLNGDGSTYVDDDAAAAAVQLLVGAAAPLTEHLELTTEYRYWLTGQFKMEQPDGRPLHTELSMQSVMLGLRYRF